MVEHRFRKRLVCHQCGATKPIPTACPACKVEGRMTVLGPGVERLAEEAAALWPDARLAILSSDLADGPRALKARIEEIASGGADLVIGTQLVSKGHNFPLLTLVGVIDADLGLQGGDLRAAEKTFQLIRQVAGRAGRAERPGLALVQTHQPEHPAIRAILSGDDEGFWRAEAEARRRALMPPYGRLAGVVVTGTDEPRTWEVARALARASAPLTQAGAELFGPGAGADRPHPRPPSPAAAGARRQGRGAAAGAAGLGRLGSLPGQRAGDDRRRSAELLLNGLTGTSMADLIRFLLSNFTLTFFVIGLVAAAIEVARQPAPRPEGALVEAVLAWFLFFSIGASFLYNAVFHIFFGDMAARFIGWENSPFQVEVGFASLGFAAVGFLAFRRGREVRLAAVLGPALFLWGAAAGHVVDMVRSHNFAPGNAGVIFWTDILLPIFGFALLALARPLPPLIAAGAAGPVAQAGDSRVWPPPEVTRTRWPTEKTGSLWITAIDWPPSSCTVHSIELTLAAARPACWPATTPAVPADHGGDVLAGAAAHLVAERRAGDAAEHRAGELAALAAFDDHVARAGDGAEAHRLRGLRRARADPVGAVLRRAGRQGRDEGERGGASEGCSQHVDDFLSIGAKSCVRGSPATCHSPASTPVQRPKPSGRAIARRGRPAGVNPRTSASVSRRFPVVFP